MAENENILKKEAAEVKEFGEMSKYDEMLRKYDTPLSDESVKAVVKKIAEEKVPENETLEVKKLLFNCIDLTTLKTTDSEESVLKFTEKVNDFEDKYPDLPNVAAICVYPNFAKIVSQSQCSLNVYKPCWLNCSYNVLRWSQTTMNVSLTSFFTIMIISF